MTETFKPVPTFHLEDGESMAYINSRDNKWMTFEFDCSTLNVSNARKLRDWLTSAIDLCACGASPGQQPHTDTCSAADGEVK